MLLRGWLLLVAVEMMVLEEAGGAVDEEGSAAEDVGCAEAAGAEVFGFLGGGSDIGVVGGSLRFERGVAVGGGEGVSCGGESGLGGRIDNGETWRGEVGGEWGGDSIGLPMVRMKEMREKIKDAGGSWG
ncbi:uncharacterized protein LOC131175318 [Hevea brasiliensis]|uniref:uncharacterized protein LOC131175318 n=1 Tax=Hevea brasiliensis TaxID=3981 RepID=UPI0025CD1673|nr:uncharacterized protein LOC131175318 [Hevea brasiliensis]